MSIKSTIVHYQLLISAKRWDFEYFDPIYVETINKINDSGWNIFKLKDIVEDLTDGQHGYLVHTLEGVPLLRTTNIFEHEIRLDDVRYIDPEVHSGIKRSQLKPGDVLLTTIGSLGIAAVVSAELGEANINQNLVKITPKDEVNSDFLSLFLNSNLGRIQTQRTASKSVVPIISYSRLKNIIIPLPPRAVQNQIAQIMQEAYRDRQRKSDQSNNIYKGLGSLVLERLGINLNSIQSKKSDLVSIARVKGGRFDFEAVVTTWDVLNSLGDQQTTALHEVVHQVKDRITPAEDFPKEYVNYIGLADIESNTGELSGFQPTEGSKILSSSPTFEKGDILYGRMRPYLNKVWVAEFDGVCSGEALVFRAKTDKVDVRFLHTLLLSQLTLDQVIPLQSGSSLPRVSASDVLSIKLPVPEKIESQKELGDEIAKRRAEAKRLKAEAESVVVESKARVERLILGKEEADDDSQGDAPE